MEENVCTLYEYLGVLTNKKVNPLIVPPVDLCNIIVKVKHDMIKKIYTTITDDPDRNIWAYVFIMKVTPVAIDNFLLVLLIFPLIDRSLPMNLYKVHTLPALHPDLEEQFSYHLGRATLGNF